MSASDSESNFQRLTWSDEGAQPPDEESDPTQLWMPEDDALPPEHLLMWLVVSAPRARRGTILVVQPDDVIGRHSEADIQWADPRLSRRHARFTLESDPGTPDDPTPAYFIWPLEARHPILLDGQPIRGATRLRENAALQMGDTTFVVKLLP
jgi:hypothetical protein